MSPQSRGFLEVQLKRFVSFRKSDIRTLLKFQVLVPVFVFVIFGISAFASLQHLIGFMRPILEEDIPASVQEGEMNAQFHQFMFLLMASNQPGITPRQRAEHMKAAKHRFRAFNESVQVYSRLKKPKATEEFFRFILEGRNELKMAMEEAFVVVDAIQSGQRTPEDLAKMFEMSLIPTSEPIVNALENLAALHLLAQIETKKAIAETANESFVLMVSICAFSTLLVLTQGYWLRRRTLDLLKGLTSRLLVAYDSAAASRSDLDLASSALMITARDTTAALEENSTALLQIDSIVVKAKNDTMASTENSARSVEMAKQGSIAVTSIAQAIEQVETRCKKIDEYSEIVNSDRCQSTFKDVKESVQTARLKAIRLDVTFKQILNNTAELDSLLHGISGAMSQQATAANSLKEKATDLNEVAYQNKVIATRVIRTAQRLRQDGKNLEQALRTLSETIGYPWNSGPSTSRETKTDRGTKAPPSKAA